MKPDAKLDSMRKTILLVVFALSMLGSVAVHADPPGPACPPICDDNGNGLNGSGNGNFR
jgi:hypothetical protein